jgi:hypothetical protein
LKRKKITKGIARLLCSMRKYNPESVKWQVVFPHIVCRSFRLAAPVIREDKVESETDIHPPSRRHIPAHFYN